MARRRFFVDQVRNGQAEIIGDGAQHLVRVLRVEPGQKFEISDSHRVWLAEVETARKSLVKFTVLEEIDTGSELLPLTLYMALIKFERFEWAVEKATELGVTRIIPVEANRTDRGLFEGARKRVERWRRIAHEASEQSRRLRTPEIGDPVRFREAITDTAPHRVWLDERAGAPALISIFHESAGDSKALAIGPEGGWTDEERAAFAAAGWRGASLGRFVLRAETAACAALAVTAQMGLSDTIDEA